MRTFGRSYGGLIKPPPGAALNLAHPLAQGLVGYWIAPDAGFTLQNLAAPGTSPGSVSGTNPTFLEGPYGFGQKFNTSSYYDLGIVERLQPPFPVSLFVVWSPVSAAGFPSPLSTGCNATLYSGVSLFLTPNPRIVYGNNTDNGGGSNTGLQFKSGTSTVSNNQWHALSGTYRAASDASIYLNGHNDGGSFTGTGVTLVNGIGSTKVGSAFSGASGLAMNGTWVVAAIWNRNLTDQDHMQMAQDPFGLLYGNALPFAAAGVGAPGSITVPGIAAATTVYSPTVSGPAVGPLEDQGVSVSLG